MNVQVLNDVLIRISSQMHSELHGLRYRRKQTDGLALAAEDRLSVGGESSCTTNTKTGHLGPSI